MSAITPVPYALNGATIKIGTNTFDQAISSGTIVPSSSTAYVKGLSGLVFPYTTVPTWVCNLKFMQDLKTSGSLQNFLLANSGQTVTIVFTLAPGTTGSPVITISATLVPAQIGDDMDKLAEASVSFACTVPVVTAAP